MRRSFGGSSYRSNYQGRSQGGYSSRNDRRDYRRDDQPRQEFHSTQEQRDEFGERVRELTASYFSRGMTLAKLPGGIPLCFAVGRCLVEDYKEWMSFKDYCEKKAKDQAKIEVYGAEQPPFTWGIRPIASSVLQPLDSPATQAWVWDFVLLNVAPFPAARNAVARGLAQMVTEERAAGTAGLENAEQWVDQLKQAMAAQVFPVDDLLSWFCAYITTDTRVTPAELSEMFSEGTEQDANLTNLATLKQTAAQATRQAERLANRQARTDQQLRNLQAVVESEREGPAPAQRYPPAPPPQVQGFLSDDPEDDA